MQRRCRWDIEVRVRSYARSYEINGSGFSEWAIRPHFVHSGPGCKIHEVIGTVANVLGPLRDGGCDYRSMGKSASTALMFPFGMPTKSGWPENSKFSRASLNRLSALQPPLSLTATWAASQPYGTPSLSVLNKSPLEGPKISGTCVNSHSFALTPPISTTG